jgi:hypothetical protein
MGLLTPVEQQTKEVFGMVPMDERLSILPRYSSTQGLIAPQFIYDLARAVSSPITAMRGQQVSPEESLNVAMGAMGGSSIGSAPKGALRSGFLKDQGSIKPTGLLPSPQSLTMPSVPTVDQMKKYGRTEVVPLSKAVSFQSARNWEKFNAGKGPGDLVAGYGDKPLALRLETGEYVIYDGNHRTDLALSKGKTELPMHVIDVKSYDPAHAGRKPVPDKMSSDELLKMLFGNNGR